VTITFVGHGTLVIQWGQLVVHVDPVGEYGDYAKLPKADLVLVTHDHFDHLDAAAIEAARKQGTEIVLTAKCAAKVKGTVMANGDRRTFKGIDVEAVPAYNIKHERSAGKPFHPKGEGNGYVLTLGGLRVYVAGDTENTPEMKALAGIDVAFLPMNLPYTMTPEMVADAALAFCHDLATRAPIALRYMKENVNRALGTTLAEALDAEAAAMVRTMSTADHREAAAAFVEKRSPKFSGR